MSETTVSFRSALECDLPRLVALLKSDSIAAAREARDDAEEALYGEAFAAIMADPNNDLLVAEIEGSVVGFLQMTLIPGLGRKAATRLHIETVRVDAAHQSRGIGSALMRYAMDVGTKRGASLVQLTTDLQRKDAHRFYERIGFTATHVGYKKIL